MEHLFSMDRLRRDILAFGNLPGWSITRLARESDVEQGSLSRFVNDKLKSLNGETIEKLWPFLYGDRRPAPAEHEPQEAA